MTRVEEIFWDGLRSKVYSAGALAIGKPDRVLLSLAAGNVSYEPDAASVTPDTMFDMASCSKILGTTMVAYHMIENGLLCLYDKVADFFPNCPEDKKEITVRHLMTHTSGIPAEILLWKYCSDPSEAVDKILQTPLAYPIGTNVQYSCMGFILLGKIMEKIMKEPLDSLAERWTFSPLQMTRTAYHPVDKTKEDRSTAYTELKTLAYPGVPSLVHDENARFLNGVSGNAGVFSTLNDMIKFCNMLAKKGKPILTKRMIEIGSKNYTLGMDENRGLGLQLTGPSPTFAGDLWGDNAIGHTGYTGTSFVVDPESGLYVIYLTNRVYPTRDNNGLTRLRHQIHNAAISEFLNA